VESEPHSPTPTLVGLIQQTGGISATARALGVEYVTVHAWARGYWRPSQAHLARLLALAAATPSHPARALRPPRPTRPRRPPPGAEQLALVRDAIRRAGGRTVVARALGVTTGAVRSWDVGTAWPAGDRFQQLMSLPDGAPLRPGPPRRPRLADTAIFEEAVSVAGSVSAAARELGLERRTVQRYLHREREVPGDVLEHAREFLAANGATPAPQERPPS
jgi:transposase-like protein